MHELIPREGEYECVDKKSLYAILNSGGLKIKRYLLDLVIEKDKEGYFVYCPLIQGCYTQGNTYEEALENIKDAIKLHLEEIEASKGVLSSPESISVTTLEIAA